MPELPEVETVRRGLEPAMVGARIERGRGPARTTSAFRSRRVSGERLTGWRIEALTRRAESICFSPSTAARR